MNDMRARIERAAREALYGRYQREWDAEPFDELSDAEKSQWISEAEAALRAAFPELFADPPTHWLAPTEGIKHKTRPQTIPERGFRPEINIPDRSPFGRKKKWENNIP